MIRGMRFLLVDRITELKAGETVTAIKHLTRSEEYLGDHFPGFPVMPGVLMLESLVQASAWLWRATEEFKFSTILLKQSKALRFNSFLTPGQTLVVTSRIHKAGEVECTFKAGGTVNGTSAVNARITLEQFNLADRAPALAQADASRIAALRNDFARLWQPK